MLKFASNNVQKLFILFGGEGVIKRSHWKTGVWRSVGQKRPREQTHGDRPQSGALLQPRQVLACWADNWGTIPRAPRCCQTILYLLIHFDQGGGEGGQISVTRKFPNFRGLNYPVNMSLFALLVPHITSAFLEIYVINLSYDCGISFIYFIVKVLHLYLLHYKLIKINYIVIIRSNALTLRIIFPILAFIFKVLFLMAKNILINVE